MGLLKLFTAAVVSSAIILSTAQGAAAAPPRPPKPDRGHDHAVILGRPGTARAAKPGAPLPKITGSVPLRRDLSVRPNAKTLAAPATGPAKVGLRALVVGVDASDWGVDTWRSTLDRVGAAYDVLLTRDQPLTAASLTRPDGAGRYNAILLTSSMLLYDSGGTYVSGLDGTEWNILWAYERDFAVRQATLYTSYGTFPEDYCLSASSEAAVGDAILPASLTTAGAGVFDTLKSTAKVPILQSYVYRTRVTAGCAADPVLVNGSDVLGVRTTSADGRERLALTFTSNQYLTQSYLLAYGMFRWASRGLFLGEQRHFLDVDVDDWFNTADHYYPDGHVESDPGWAMTGREAYNAGQRQVALRAAYPLASGLTLNLAYNGGDADLGAGTACSPNGGVSTLTATSRCLATKFRWINHTLTHPELNHTDYATSSAEISGNRTVATRLGLPQPDAILKTGEYSGLGVYNDNPDDDVDPPTDHGLAASNAQFLAAARDLGVRYVHGNMSFPSQVPSCFNCGIVHPMEPSITVVPDWPTNIAYHTTTPAEQTAFYNSFYGPSGKFPFWPANLTYAQMLDAEAEVGLTHLATGSLYTHTFHIANLHDYGAGKTLLTDWLDRVLAKYSAFYAVPVLSPDWTALAAYATQRNAHFAALHGGVDAVYDPAAHTITVTAPAAGSVTVSGAAGSGAVTYGPEVSARLTIGAAAVTAPASPRS
ncbi:hypothetical protein [Dactylosporangium matsuzakiense]|uniref:Uncharacterized protein n=1 Tax=Dactylosporangium matsuzakiense TaxID=53360 RepID=A0A9W6KFL1_9ACTN|nr:hypothetical protein [Dactylosporangium matsuzakiense]GLK99345.1 hypothetical protein GCM10017581_010860 [Dactylosporangium matsuzakiense]